MKCRYCGESLEVDSSLRVRFEDRLKHFDVGLQRYSVLCRKSPNRPQRHDQE